MNENEEEKLKQKQFMILNTKLLERPQIKPRAQTRRLLS